MCVWGGALATKNLDLFWRYSLPLINMKGECICRPVNWLEHVPLSARFNVVVIGFVFSALYEGFSRFRCELWWRQSWMCWWAIKLDSLPHRQHHIHTSQEQDTSPVSFLHASHHISPSVSIPTLFLPLKCKHTKICGYAAGSISASKRQTTLIYMCQMGFYAFILTYQCSHREGVCSCMPRLVFVWSICEWKMPSHCRAQSHTHSVWYIVVDTFASTRNFDMARSVQCNNTDKQAAK